MVRYLTTNGKTSTYSRYEPFILRYRRVNGTFYEPVKAGLFLLKSRLVEPARSGRSLLSSLRVCRTWTTAASPGCQAPRALLLASPIRTSSCHTGL